MRIVLAIAVVVVIVGCDGEADREVLVSAASSLTDAFAGIEAAFEEAHPGVDVVLNLGGSSNLREQILEGAPVDVFASADTSNMDQVVAAGDAMGEPRTFAVNFLQIAVPAGNPAGVAGLEDFGNEELLIGVCAEGVPCGDFAREALRNAGIIPSIDTNEPDVRALLTKVEAGELDAAITYVTDVASAGGAVEGIEIPDSVNVAGEYPIAVLARAADQETATAFIEFVLSDEGQGLMAEYGFRSP
jgi:molybdate transport system substrate-binding protein